MEDADCPADQCEQWCRATRVAQLPGHRAARRAAPDRGLVGGDEAERGHQTGAGERSASSGPTASANTARRAPIVAVNLDVHRVSVTIGRGRDGARAAAQADIGPPGFASPGGRASSAATSFSMAVR